MYKLLSGIMLIVLCVIFYRFQSEQINMVEETQNLVDLTGADLTGANFDSAIFCNTTMPDKRINSSGCATMRDCRARKESSPTRCASEACGRGRR